MYRLHREYKKQQEFITVARLKLAACEAQNSKL